MDDNETIHPTGADEDQAIWDSLEDGDQSSSADDNAGGGADQDVQSSTGAQVDTTVDLWASAPEPLRAAYEATRREKDAVETNYKRVSGTVSALQRRINELNAQPSGKSAGASASNFLDSAELKQAKEEYPEVVGPMEQALRALSDQNTSLAKQVEERFSQSDQREAAAYYIGQEHALTDRVPDWKEQTAKPEFRAWLGSQPQYVQEGIQRNATRIIDAFEAADIVERFKSSLGAPPQSPQQGAKRQAQLESSVAPKGRGGHSKLTSGPPEGSDQEIWDYWAAQEKRTAR